MSLTSPCLTLHPSFAFRISDFCRSLRHRAYTGNGAVQSSGGGQPILAPPSPFRLCCGSEHICTLLRLPPAWVPEKPCSIPGPGPSPKSGPLPPSLKPAQPAWQPSISQRCLPEVGCTGTALPAASEAAREWGRWDGRLTLQKRMGN